MPAQTPGAPLAAAASQVDLAYYALANPRSVVRFQNLADEFVSRRASKSIVASLEFQVRVADARV
jgi:hypothetical protein